MILPAPVWADLWYIVAMKKLPVAKALPQIRAGLSQGNNLVLTAAPGAGKSTLVPIELLAEPWLQGKKILVLQPRRVAALAVARRMAFLSGTEPGQLVGHQVRFSRNISAKTRIEVLTEGILTRRIQSDPFLEDAGLIIFDEFHERSIHSDLCLALCREIQKDVRPDLKILVMSATIDSDNLAGFLGQCPVVVAEGFLHPVEIIYREISAGRNRFLAMAEALNQIIASSPADESYLVFLPGAGEIAMFRDELSGRTSREIVCLHGSLSLAEQEKVLRPCTSPRVVLATNIAETSLTIDGITTVVDTGFCRRLNLNPATGLETLELQRISQASASQRAGRAGRLLPGRAFRLWSKAEHAALPEFEEAEILRLDLAATVLELAGWGVSEPEKFAWFESPGPAQIVAAQELLKQLRALDLQGRITEAGKSMLRMPLHPRLACMLLQAQERGAAALAAQAAAIISERDFVRSSGEQSDADLFLRLELMQDPAKSGDVDRRGLERVRRVADQLLALLNEGNAKADATYPALKKALLAAFPDRLCQLRNDSDKSAYKICTGQGFSLVHGRGDRYIVALNLDARLRKGRNDGQIFLYVAVDAAMIPEMLGHLCLSSREIFFCQKRHAVLVRNVTRFHELILNENEDRLQPEERSMAEKMLIGHAFADLKQAFNFAAPANAMFLNKLRLLEENGFKSEFLPLDQDWFKENFENISAGATNFADLQKLSLEEIYFSTMSYKFKQKFEQLLPDRIAVPSGKQIAIEYPESGAPFIRVKIQEMFGQKETPAICDGRIRLVVHLLSPAQRPVQITSDLKSFWENGYKTVIAELKGRYPRHPWPDDPAQGIAFAGTRKQLERKLESSVEKPQKRRNS